MGVTEKKGVRLGLRAGDLGSRDAGEMGLDGHHACGGAEDREGGALGWEWGLAAAHGLRV